MSAFERPRRRSSNKDVGEKYDLPCCEAKFYWEYKCIKYFTELLSFSWSSKWYARAFANIRIIACAMMLLENNLA